MTQEEKEAQDRMAAWLRSEEYAAFVAEYCAMVDARVGWKEGQDG